MVQRSALAGFGPRGWQQGSRCRRPGQAASLSTPRTAGITARPFCFQEPPPPILFFSLVFYFPSLPFSSSPASQALRIDPVQDRLSCLRMRPIRQLSAGSTPNRFYFHFPGASLLLLRRSRTAGRRPTARGRSGGLDSFLPVPTSPGGLVCRGPCAVPCCLLCPLGKPPIPRREPALALAAGPRRPRRLL